MGNPAAIVTSPVRAGTRAAEFVVNRLTDSSEFRTEILIVEPKLVIGQTYWLGVSHFIPSNYAPDNSIDVNYNIHSRPDVGEDVDGAPFSLRTFGNNWDLVVRGDPNRRSPSSTTVVRNLDLGPIQKGQWTDWVFRIRLSYLSDASLEVWKNGVRVLDYRGPNVYNDALGPFIKMGIYKPAWRSATNSPITQRTLFIDDVRIGDANSSFAEVSPGAPPPAPQPGSVQFSSAAYGVNEQAGTATITASRLGGSVGPVSVNYTTGAGGSATDGADYTFTSGTLNWANGDTASKNFTVPIINDSDVEGDETVSLSLNSPNGGATLGAPNTAVLNIADNDQAPAPQPGSVQFSSSAYSVNEASGAATITASRLGGSTGSASVSYTTSTGGTAIDGADYTFTSGTLNWANGDAATKAFSVPIINDADAEGNETVGLALSNAIGATLGAPNTSALTIVSDDQTIPPPGGTCGGRTPTIVGTAASESITGTVGPDVIDGLGGNDLITGLDGDDVICGDEGNDTLQSSLGNDVAFGEGGDDIARGGDGNDRVSGGDGTDQLFGDQLNDTLSGGTGTDRCDGGTGTDTASTCESGVNFP